MRLRLLYVGVGKWLNAAWERLHGVWEWLDAPWTCLFGGWERLNGVREWLDGLTACTVEVWECRIALKSPVQYAKLWGRNSNQSR